MSCTLNDEALRFIKYDETAGKLFWLPRPVEMFKAERYQTTWNKKNAGREAFTAVGSHGYKCGDFLGDYWLAHRLIFLIKGERLPKIVDHINGDKLDNRWSNLRSVDYTENSRNRGLGLKNKSGCLGVSKLPKGRWHSRIIVGGETICLGNFDSLDEAIKVRKEAEVIYGFHENHSRARG